MHIFSFFPNPSDLSCDEQEQNVGQSKEMGLCYDNLWAHIEIKALYKRGRFTALR